MALKKFLKNGSSILCEPCVRLPIHSSAITGLVGTQGPVSSVLIEKHSSEQATSGAPPIRLPHGQRASQARSTGARTSRALAVQTIHTTPVKVVH